MALKYYSDITKKAYDTEAEFVAAEEEANKKLDEERIKKEERANAAKEVEAQYKLAAEEMDKANNLLADFVKKYGSYHQTITNAKVPSKTLFDYFFDQFWF